MNFRWINGWDCSQEDWDRIEGVLAARGWMSLARPTSRILVAEDEYGLLLGFSCLQLVPHLEPLFVLPSIRGSGLAEELADKMVEFVLDMKVRGFMVVAESPYAVKLCEDRGFKKVECPVFVSL